MARWAAAASGAESAAAAAVTTNQAASAAAAVAHWTAAAAAVVCAVLQHILMLRCGMPPYCLQSSPHLLVVWRPDLHTYTAHLMHKVNGSAAVNAKMNNADLPRVVVQGLGKAIQLWQEDVHVSHASTCGQGMKASAAAAAVPPSSIRTAAVAAAAGSAPWVPASIHCWHKMHALWPLPGVLGCGSRHCLPATCSRARHWFRRQSGR